MSLELAGFAFRARMGSHVRKLILIKLVDCCRDDGSKIFPAVASIADAAECSPRTVQRAFREFEKIDLLTRVREGGRHGPGAASTAEYRLDVGRLKRLAEEGWPGLAPEAGETAEPARDAAPLGEDEVPTGDSLSPLRGDAIVSPLAAEGVTPATERGDTAVSPEPLRGTLKPERVGARARGQAGEGQEESGGFEDALKRFRRIWTTTSVDDPVLVANAMARLSVEDREAAITAAPTFLAELKAKGRKHVPSGANFLGHRRWEMVEAAAGSQAGKAGDVSGRTYLADWSKLWWAYALWRARAGATKQEMRRQIYFAERHKCGVYVKPEEPLSDVQAIAAELAAVMSNEARAKAWADWFMVRGFDLRDSFYGKPFAVYLPAHDPPAEPLAETDDEILDALQRT